MLILLLLFTFCCCKPVLNMLKCAVYIICSLCLCVNYYKRFTWPWKKHFNITRAEGRTLSIQVLREQSRKGNTAYQSEISISQETGLSTPEQKECQKSKFWNRQTKRYLVDHRNPNSPVAPCWQDPAGLSSSFVFRVGVLWTPDQVACDFAQPNVEIAQQWRYLISSGSKDGGSPRLWSQGCTILLEKCSLMSNLNFSSCSGIFVAILPILVGTWISPAPSISFHT